MNVLATHVCSGMLRERNAPASRMSLNPRMTEGLDDNDGIQCDLTKSIRPACVLVGSIDGASSRTTVFEEDSIVVAVSISSIYFNHVLTWCRQTSSQDTWPSVWLLPHHFSVNDSAAPKRLCQVSHSLIGGNRVFGHC